MDLQNKRTHKTNRNMKSVQFSIRIFKDEKETRFFSVFSSDSSEDAAKKMVQNLKLDEFQVPFWAAYIEERRLELGLQNFGSKSPGRVIKITKL